MDLIFKSFQINLKSLTEEKLSKGMISVVFATMGVWDKDGDIATPGFYGEQDVMLLPTHDWSHVPIGKGRTREDGNQAIADIQMNLDIQAAKDWLSAIKFDLKVGKPIQEYSYGFKVLEGGMRQGEMLGRTGRILQPREDGAPGSKIWEISPVLVGAGEKTRTLSAKSAKNATMNECIEACRRCIEACVKCMVACQENDFEECAAMCRACIDSCLACIKACLAGDMGAAMAACAATAAACAACEAVCRKQAELCKVAGLAECAAACAACARECADCAAVCLAAASGPMKGVAAGAGKTFSDESQAVLDAADLLIERAKALAALRMKDGRELSAPNKERLSAMANSFQEYAKTLTSLTAPAAVVVPESEVSARRELVRMVKNRAGIK